MAVRALLTIRYELLGLLLLGLLVGIPKQLPAICFAVELKADRVVPV